GAGVQGRPYQFRAPPWQGAQVWPWLEVSWRIPESEAIFATASFVPRPGFRCNGSIFSSGSRLQPTAGCVIPCEGAAERPSRAAPDRQPPSCDGEKRERPVPSEVLEFGPFAFLWLARTSPRADRPKTGPRLSHRLENAKQPVARG